MYVAYCGCGIRLIDSVVIVSEGQCFVLDCLRKRERVVASSSSIRYGKMQL